MAKGAFVAEKDGTFSVNLEKAKRPCKIWITTY